MDSIAGIWWCTGRNSNESFEASNIFFFCQINANSTYCLDCDAFLSISLTLTSDHLLWPCLALFIAGLKREPHMQLYIAIAFLAEWWESKINRADVLFFISSIFRFLLDGQGGCCDGGGGGGGKLKLYASHAEMKSQKNEKESEWAYFFRISKQCSLEHTPTLWQNTKCKHNI